MTADCGVDAGLRRVESVLPSVVLDLFRGETLQPVECEDALPEIALAVQYLEALEHQTN